MQDKAFWVLGVLAFIVVLLAAVCFSFSGLSGQDLLSLSVQDKWEKVTSGAFIVFALLLPTIAGLVSVAPVLLDRRKALISILLGSGLALLLAGIVFPSVSDFWLAGALGWLGAAWAIYSIYIQKDELKHWVGARLAFNSTKTVLRWMSIGVFLVAAFTVLGSYPLFLNEFENKLLNASLPIENGKLSLKENLQSTLVGLSVNGQRQVLNQMVVSESFSALETKTDPDVQAFVLSTQAIQQQVNSPQYLAQSRQQLEQSVSGNAISSEALLRLLKEQFPLFQTMEDWLWLLYAFAVVSAFTALAMILQVVGLAWGFVFQKTLPQWLIPIPDENRF